MGAPKDPEKRRDFYRRKHEKRKARRLVDPEFDAKMRQRNRERSARRAAALRPEREKARAEREAAKAAARAAAAAERDAAKAARRVERQERSFRAKQKAVAVRNANKRARKAGLPFGLKVSDVAWPQVCPVLGLRLEYGRWDGVTLANRPSLDRIDPSKGYVPGNVHVISFRANTLKNNATPAELRAVAEYFEVFHG